MNDGTLTTRDNCWYAICEQLYEVPREEIDRARYCLTQAVPKHMTEGKYEIRFILSYFLQSCMKVSLLFITSALDFEYSRCVVIFYHFQITSDHLATIKKWCFIIKVYPHIHSLICTNASTCCNCDAQVIEKQYSGTHNLTHKTVTFSTQGSNPCIKSRV